MAVFVDYINFMEGFNVSFSGGIRALDGPRPLAKGMYMYLF
jgi:hypothetical protein